MPRAVASDCVRARVEERDPVIDVTRGIAIALVVLGHNRAINLWSSPFVDVLFLFHVPLFFLLSGYVFRREGLLVALSKLTRRLLVPCFAAALLVGMAKAAFRDQSLVQTLIGIAWATGQTLPWSHLWFLPTLFLALLTVQMLGPLLGERPMAWAAAALLAAVLGFALPFGGEHSVAGYEFVHPVGLPWGIDLLAICVFFVLLGQLLRVSPWLSGRIRGVIASSLAAGIFAWSVSAAQVDLNLRVFEPFLPALMAGISGCVLTLNAATAISRAEPIARTLAFVGRHTMPIFLLHVSIQKLLLRLDSQLLQALEQAWIPGLVTAAVAILLSIVVERYLIARVHVLRYLFLPGRAV